MALPVYRTLGDLRVRVARRVGYSADPNAANADTVRSWVQAAQTDLWEQMEAWTRAVVDFRIPTQRGVWRYEWPERCDPDRLQYVYLQWDENQVTELREGFDVSQYDLRGEYTSWPTRYRRRDLLEVFPTPDEDTYELIVGVQRTLAPFEEDGDRCTVPDDMVEKQAIIYGWEHLGRGIPASTAQALQARVDQIRARSHTGPYLAGGPGGGTGAGASPWPRPISIGPPTYD